jgi:hypothetical protein
VGSSLEAQNSEVNHGAKSLFFGVEVGEGVVKNGTVMPPSEPPRKGGQSEVLVIPEEVKHYAQG